MSRQFYSFIHPGHGQPESNGTLAQQKLSQSFFLFKEPCKYGLSVNMFWAH